MKKIEAVIKPFKLEAVQRALAELGVGGMAVTEVRGFARKKGRSERHSGSTSGMTFMPKVKLRWLFMTTTPPGKRNSSSRQQRPAKTATDGFCSPYRVRHAHPHRRAGRGSSTTFMGGAVERARKSDGVLPTGILRFSSVSSRYCLSMSAASLWASQT